jgi:hypothetical protein
VSDIAVLVIGFVVVLGITLGLLWAGSDDDGGGFA